MQARIVADDLAGLGVRFQPGRHAAVHGISDLEQANIDLVWRLQSIAAVDEQSGLILHHHRRTGRASEAGGPGQAVVGVRQVLVVVLVLVRNDETVQTLSRHALADQRQVQRPVGSVSGVFEALAHFTSPYRRSGLDRSGRCQPVPCRPLSVK